MLCKVKFDCQLAEGNDRFMLSPGKVIDEIWHEMLLRPLLYMKYMRYLFNNERDQETSSSSSSSFSSSSLVDHQPEAFHDDDGMKLKRLQKTEEVWKDLFGVEDKFPGSKDMFDIEDSRNSEINAILPNPKRVRLNEIKEESDHINITIIALDQTQFQVFLPQDSTVGTLKERLRDIEGINVDKVRLVCSSIQLENFIPIKDLPSQIVQLFPCLSGC